MELTPRTGPEADSAGASGNGRGTATVPRAPRKRRLPVVIAIVVILGVGGFVLINALGNATTFYRNVDEAVAQQSMLGTKRFRIQGTVVPGSVQTTGEGATFELTFNGVEIPVQHRGDPPEMFKENEAVVLEGHFAGDTTPTYDSDLMIVKHSNEYESKNSERLKQAQEGGQVPVSTP